MTWQRRTFAKNQSAEIRSPRPISRAMHPTAAAAAAEGEESSMHSAFVRGTGGLQPRAHQLHTLHTLSAMVRKDCKKRRATNYLLQHSTGSGKSLTMAALARACARPAMVKQLYNELPSARRSLRGKG